MGRYATKEDVKELTVQIKALTSNVLEMAKWNLLIAVERDPHAFPPIVRKKILEETKEFPIVHLAIEEIFNKHSPTFSKTVVQKLNEKGDGKK